MQRESTEDRSQMDGLLEVGDVELGIVLDDDQHFNDDDGSQSDESGAFIVHEASPVTSPQVRGPLVPALKVGRMDSARSGSASSRADPSPRGPVGQPAVAHTLVTTPRLTRSSSSTSNLSSHPGGSQIVEGRVVTPGIATWTRRGQQQQQPPPPSHMVHVISTDRLSSMSEDTTQQYQQPVPQHSPPHHQHNFNSELTALMDHSTTPPQRAVAVGVLDGEANDPDPSLLALVAGGDSSASNTPKPKEDPLLVDEDRNASFSTPLKEYKEDTKAEEEQEEERCCAICLDDFSDDNPASPNPCGHMFHLACLLSWQQRSNTCPMCMSVNGGDPEPDLRDMNFDTPDASDEEGEGGVRNRRGGRRTNTTSRLVAGGGGGGGSQRQLSDDDLRSLMAMLMAQQQPHLHRSGSRGTNRIVMAPRPVLQQTGTAARRAARRERYHAHDSDDDEPNFSTDEEDHEVGPGADIRHPSSHHRTRQASAPLTSAPALVAVPTVVSDDDNDAGGGPGGRPPPHKPSFWAKICGCCRK